MSIYTYFAQNFLLPTLAGLVCLILGGEKKWPLRKLAVYTFLVVVLAFGVSWSAARIDVPKPPLIMAGTIVDESNQPIGQATITLADGSKRSLSEDNGNYRLDLTDKVKEKEKVRIRVDKQGYLSADAVVEVPAEGFIIRLRHL